MDAIVVTESVRVPATALTMRAVRASGPGGQNVNKVASKVDLRVDLDVDGRLQITSQATRDQARNLEDAREKVRALVTAALHEPKRRRASRPTPAARERRIESKKRRGTLKRLRTRPNHGF